MTVDSIREEIARNLKIADAIMAEILTGAIGGTHGVDASNGYVVGGYADSLVIRRRTGTSPDSLYNAIYGYVAENASWDSAYGIGWWRDSATGRFWLDVVSVHATESGARRSAVANGELAIWDGVEQCEIRV